MQDGAELANNYSILRSIEVPKGTNALSKSYELDPIEIKPDSNSKKPDSPKDIVQVLTKKEDEANSDFNSGQMYENMAPTSKQEEHVYNNLKKHPQRDLTTHSMKERGSTELMNETTGSMELYATISSVTKKKRNKKVSVSVSDKDIFSGQESNNVFITMPPTPSSSTPPSRPEHRPLPPPPPGEGGAKDSRNEEGEVGGEVRQGKMDNTPTSSELDATYEVLSNPLKDRTERKDLKSESLVSIPTPQDIQEYLYQAIEQNYNKSSLERAKKIFRKKVQKLQKREPTLVLIEEKAKRDLSAKLGDNGGEDEYEVLNSVSAKLRDNGGEEEYEVMNTVSAKQRDNGGEEEYEVMNTVSAKQRDNGGEEEYEVMNTVSAKQRDNGGEEEYEVMNTVSAKQRDNGGEEEYEVMNTVSAKQRGDELYEEIVGDNGGEEVYEEIFNENKKITN